MYIYTHVYMLIKKRTRGSKASGALRHYSVAVVSSCVSCGCLFMADAPCLGGPRNSSQDDS